MPSVLIVDDLISLHELFEAVINPIGFTTSFATDGETALVRYAAEKFDLVLADIDMRPMDGLTLLKELKLRDPSVVVIIMTAYASTESAVQALKYGAFDYMQKPFRVDELIATLRRALEFRNFQRERTALAVAPDIIAADIEVRLIGHGLKLPKLMAQVKKLAAGRTPVLLTGEQGTGRAAVAEIFHTANSPAGAPLLRVDCALSSDAHFREALLGTNGDGGAWIKEAKGGTLFLQNLHTLSEELQKELVSVLRNTGHGFRLICTTSEDLEKLVDAGRFNDELFYRVATLPIHIPPLRERLDDLPLLIKHFSTRATNLQLEPSSIEFTEDALAVMRTYHWPGNLTELNQVVSKIAATTETRIITSQQLPPRLRTLQHWPTLAEFLTGQEQQYLDRVIYACRGDKAAAAKILGVSIARLG
jgi:DNA-binding NtrC family response regulator